MTPSSARMRAALPSAAPHATEAHQLGCGRRPLRCPRAAPAAARAVSAAAGTSPLPPPRPEPQPMRLPGPPDEPHEERSDPFAWLQDPARRGEALRYLAQEATYAKLHLQRLAPLRLQLEQELAGLTFAEALSLAARQQQHQQQEHQQQTKENDGAPGGAGSSAVARYGVFLYRREPVPGAPGRTVHLRVAPDNADMLQPPLPPLPLTYAPTAAAAAAAAATVVLDESARAASACQPSGHSVHAFAPSPDFALAAFTEATEPVPPGERRPDRFTLHVLDAATGVPRGSPVPGVSGDVGWVVGPGVAPGSCPRTLLYFTRAAQRELWCVDLTAAHDGAHAAIAQQAQQGGQEPRSWPAALVFRDPDGQPIQLVQHGSCLYAETLGNTGVPLEVRRLGVARELAQPQGPQGSTSSAQGAHVWPTESGGGLAPPPPLQEQLAALQGVSLLPRRAGRSYSVLPVPACTAAAAERGGDTRTEQLLVWLRDLEHPNGCLLTCQAGTDGHAVELRTLVPHQRNSRIVHMQASPRGCVLLLRVAVDAQGDPEARHCIEELHVAAPACAETTAFGRASPLASVEGQASGGSAAGSLAAVVVARRCLVLPTAHHVLRVEAWDVDGGVAVACSGLASPSVSVHVQLLLAREQQPQQQQPQQQQPQQQQPQQQQPQQQPQQQQQQGRQGLPALAAVDGSGGEEELQLQCAGSGDDPGAGFGLERLWAASRDGTLVPITLCRPRNAPGPLPLLLRVYGAYGKDPPLDYQPAMLALLRRGVAVAVAHVRGGGLLGPAWYEAGRGRHKANSYRDLLACAEHLAACGVTRPQLLCLEAASAGGWAAGPALNAAGATLFRAALLTVPTLDALTSLVADPAYAPYELGDASTPGGAFRSVAAWCPYAGLAARGRGGDVAWPLLLLRVGLHDTAVPVWDPAKYVARLRACCSPPPQLAIMQVKLGGHEAFEDVADDATWLSFVLWALGVWKAPRAGKRP